MLKQVQVILTWENGTRHGITAQVGDGLDQAFDDLARAAELYLEDHPNGPETGDG